VSKTALIKRITGQDGSYLAEFLLGQGYEVVGMVRRTSLENYGRIDRLQGKISLAQGDLLDQPSLATLLRCTVVIEDETAHVLASAGALVALMRVWSSRAEWSTPSCRIAPTSVASYSRRPASFLPTIQTTG